MEPRICLAALVGLPAAGKTTFSQRLLNDNQLYDYNILYLCFDHYLGDKYNLIDVKYKNQRKEILTSLHILIKYLKREQPVPTEVFSLFQTNLKFKSLNYLIICDDNNYYKSMRYKLYQLCRFEQIEYAQIYVQCTLEKALKRNRERPQIAFVPEDILKRMAEKLEVPNNEYNFWELNTFIISTDDFEAYKHELKEFFANSFNYIPRPPSPRTKSKPLIQSYLHGVDLFLRRRIRQLVNEDVIPASHKGLKAYEMNVRRKEILVQIREDLIENTAKQSCLSIELKDLNLYADMLQ